MSHGENTGNLKAHMNIIVQPLGWRPRRSKREKWARPLSTISSFFFWFPSAVEAKDSWLLHIPHQNSKTRSLTILPLQVTSVDHFVTIMAGEVTYHTNAVGMIVISHGTIHVYNQMKKKVERLLAHGMKMSISIPPFSLHFPSFWEMTACLKRDFSEDWRVAILVEDLGLAPSMHTMANNHPQSQLQGS